MFVSTSAVSRLAAIAVLVLLSTGIQASQQTARRPMTFLDMQQMRQVGSPTPSPDRRLLLYTLSTPDWKEAKRQRHFLDAATDLYQREERNRAAMVAGRDAILLSVES